jgi:hypothetical protein
VTRHKQGKGKRSTAQTPNKRKLHDTSPIAFRLMLFLFFFLLNLLLIYSFYPLLWDWFKSNTSGEVRELQFHSPVAKTCWQLSRPTSEHGNSNQQTPWRKRRKRTTIKLKVGRVIGDIPRPAWWRYPPWRWNNSSLLPYTSMRTKRMREPVGDLFCQTSFISSFLLFLMFYSF